MLLSNISVLKCSISSKVLEQCIKLAKKYFIRFRYVILKNARKLNHLIECRLHRAFGDTFQWDMKKVFIHEIWMRNVHPLHAVKEKQGSEDMCTYQLRSKAHSQKWTLKLAILAMFELFELFFWNFKLGKG